MPVRMWSVKQKRIKQRDEAASRAWGIPPPFGRHAIANRSFHIVDEVHQPGSESSCQPRESRSLPTAGSEFALPRQPPSPARHLTAPPGHTASITAAAKMSTVPPTVRNRPPAACTPCCGLLTALRALQTGSVSEADYEALVLKLHGIGVSGGGSVAGVFSVVSTCKRVQHVSMCAC